MSECFTLMTLESTICSSSGVAFTISCTIFESGAFQGARNACEHLWRQRMLDGNYCHNQILGVF